MNGGGKVDNALLKKCIELRHELHKNAELSGQEEKTKDILKKFIKDNTNLEIVDRGSYFYAVHRAGEKYENIALRADMDALPIEETIDIPYGSEKEGVAHKCGHDGHSAVMAGAAVESMDIEDKNVYILFQPGEEDGTGAKKIVDDGFLKRNGIDKIYGFHNIPGWNKGTVLLKENTFACASKGIVINLAGKPSHAAYPELGINPSYGAAEIIDFLKAAGSRECGYRGMVLCTLVGVNIGERAFGTSAGRGQIMMTIRAEFEEDLQLLQSRIIEKTKDICRAENLKCSFDFVDEFPETKNNNDEIKKLKELCVENDIKYEFLKKPMRWSEDFGYYLKEVPGAIIGIGDGIDYSGLHTQNYDFPDYIIENAVNIFKSIMKNL